MTNVERYVYATTVGVNLSRTQLQIRDGVLYAVANLTDDEGVHVVVYFSTDDGETWDAERVPEADTPMRDPKLALINFDWWIVAHGLNSAGVDTVHLIRRTVDENDAATWDDAWTPLLVDQQHPARVTDVLVDPDNQTVIHLAYDVRTSANRFAVHGAMLSTVTGELVHDDLILSRPAQDQHNGRLALLSSDVYALVFEQRLATGNWAVFYTQCTWSSWTWTTALNLSGDRVNDDGVHLSCFHPSLTVDDVGTVHVCWLMSTDDYRTTVVMYTTVIGFMPTPVAVVSGEAADDRYPWIMVDADRNLFILYNLANDHLRYVTHKAGAPAASWTEITNLATSTWTILNGWCADSNIYTLAVDNQAVTHFLRVDTVMAELFTPVSDLQITALGNNFALLAWTKARNAELVQLQRQAADVWLTAPTLLEVGTTDDHAHVVGLPLEGRYRFRLVTRDADRRRTVTPLNNDRWVLNNAEQDILLSWTPVAGATSATLEYTVETWEYVQAVGNDAGECGYVFSNELTGLRLQVFGGPQEGVSNFVYPLTAEVDERGDVHLAWELRGNVTALVVEQSLDSQRWFPASTADVVGPASTECTVTDLAQVVHWFRLRWTTLDEDTDRTTLLVSNIVSVTNCLRVVDYDATWVTLNWVDVNPSETRRMEISTDGGASWSTVVSVIDECTMTVTGLTRCTRYLFRLEHSDRFTGRRSNIVEVTTASEPVNDLTVVSVDGQTAVLRCTLDAPCESVAAHVRDTFTDEERVEAVDAEPVDGVLTFTLNDLPLGTYQAVSLEVVGGERAGTSAETLVTIDGIGPANVQVVAVDAHTLRVSADALPGITTENAGDAVLALLSVDGLSWTTVTGEAAEITSTGFSLDLPHLLQATEYTVVLVVIYGAHRGVSDPLTATTDADAFPAVHGDRLPGERSAVVVDDVAWVVDRDRVYTVDLATGTQTLVRDLATGVHRVWSACVADRAGTVHIVLAHGKRVQMLTSADVDAEPVEVYVNAAANEQLHVQALSAVDGTVTVTWEEDHGHFSHLMRAVFRHGVLVDEPRMLVNGAAGGYVVNRMPVLSDVANGRVVTALTDDALRVLSMVMDTDPASAGFAQEVVTLDAVELADAAREDAQASLRVAVDNLDGLRIGYALAEGGCAFAQFVNGEFTQVLTIADVRWLTPIMLGGQLLLVAELNDGVVTCRYDASVEMFTDLQATELTRGLDGTPMVLARDLAGSCWVVSTFAGTWTVQPVNLVEAAESNVTNGVRVENRMSLDTDQVHVELWTIGDPDDTPLMFMKVNGVTREVTDRDERGLPVHTAVHVTALEEVPSDDWAGLGIAEDAQLVVRVTTQEGAERVVDLTEWLAFSWDRATLVNKLDG